MSATALSEDEFRLLAYVCGYVERWDQHLDPGWVQEQLEWSRSRMQEVARSLAARGLVEFFEFDPPDYLRRFEPSLEPGPMSCDIRLTERGWKFLNDYSKSYTVGAGLSSPAKPSDFTSMLSMPSLRW